MNRRGLLKSLLRLPFFRKKKKDTAKVIKIKYDLLRNKYPYRTYEEKKLELPIDSDWSK